MVVEHVKEKDTLIIKKGGKEVKCKIVFTFECPENGKKYLGYTDGSLKEDGRKIIYISSYDPVCGTGKLEDVTTKEEMQLVKQILSLIDER